MKSAVSSSTDGFELYTGEGFALFPWGGHIRERQSVPWPDNVVSVYPALVAHFNENGEAFPSIERLSILSGIRKSYVSDALRLLEETKWILVTKTMSRSGRAKNRYQSMVKRECCSSDAYISISSKIILNGLWANLKPSARKLYLVLKSYSCIGAYADLGGEIFASNGYDLSELLIDCKSTFDFIPASRLATITDVDADGKALHDFCNVTKRTLLEAKADLVAHGMMRRYDGGVYTGVALPHDPGIYVPSVLKRLNDSKRQQASAKARRRTTNFINSL